MVLPSVMMNCDGICIFLMIVLVYTLPDHVLMIYVHFNKNVLNLCVFN